MAFTRGKSNQPPAKEQYQEEAGWASAFDRPDAEGNQPRFTGVGLDSEGNEIQVAIWPKRARSGVKYLRIHIEPAYDEGDSTGDAGERDEDPDDIPF